MTNNTEWEKRLSDRFDQYESPVPADMLDKIMTQERKRRLLPWFWFTAACVAIASLGGYLILSKNTGIKQEPTPIQNYVQQSNQPGFQNDAKEAEKEKNSIESNQLNANQIPILESRLTRKNVKKASSSPGNGATGRTTEDNTDNTSLSKPEQAVESESNLSIIRPEISDIPGRNVQKYPITTLKQTIQPLPANNRLPGELAFSEGTCYGFKKHKQWHLYAALYTGLGQANRNWTASSESQPYLQKRTDSETVRYSASAGLRIGLQSPAGFCAESGLEYLGINDRFEYVNSRETRILIKDVFDAGGNLIRTDTIRQTGTRNVVTYNRYHIIQLPLRLGYDKHTGDWTYGFRIGGAFNLMNLRKGNILDPTNALYDIGKDASSYYVSRLGFSLQGSLVAGYRLGKHVSAFAEPQFNMMLGSMNTANYPLNIRYNALNLQIGIRYNN